MIMKNYENRTTFTLHFAPPTPIFGLALAQIEHNGYVCFGSALMEIA